MQIFITGGTGFIGQALVTKLLELGYSVTLLTRNPKAVSNLEVKTCSTIPDLSPFDGVINLAGENIFSQRWSKSRKTQLWQSRVDLTRQLVAQIQASQIKPKFFISASAVGIYGHRPKEILNEASLITDNSFEAQLCQGWEKALQALEQNQTRVCQIRFGMVWDQRGGAWQKIYAQYQRHLGGIIGIGKQYWAWISLVDAVRGIIFLMENSNLQGVFNFTAIEAITNEVFHHKLCQLTSSFNYCHAPEFALRLVLGERANLLLHSQQVIPEKLLKAGFEFQYPTFNAFINSLEYQV